MKCPVDDALLEMTEREGVEVDYCPQCRGVWLDRGELDRIIERAAMRQPSKVPEGRDHDSRSAAGATQGKKSRLAFLGDLLGGD